MTCASWNPVSLTPPQPFYPNITLPSPTVLAETEPQVFNQWREKAKRMWLAFWQKKWRYKGFTDEQEDELVAMYRQGREDIFGTEKYYCGFSGKKYWNLNINWEASWEASKPAWYPAD